MKKISYTLSCIKQISILSFSISFVCLVVILLIICVTPRWNSATAHSPSGKELNSSFQEKSPFFRALHLHIQILLHPASCLFGTQQQLTLPPVKSSTLPLRKIPVFQGVAPRHAISTLSCVIPLWDSATAHSPSGKELKLSSLKECFSGLIVVLMFSLYPAWALLGLVPPNVHLYYIWFRPLLSKIFYSMCRLFL